MSKNVKITSSSDHILKEENNVYTESVESMTDAIQVQKPKQSMKYELHTDLQRINLMFDMMQHRLSPTLLT